MKKQFYSISNVLLSSLIAILGLGSCKSSKNIETVYGPPPTDSIRDMQDIKEVYGPPPVEYDQEAIKEQQRQDSIRRVIQRQKEMKVVYGPPPVRYQEEKKQ